jgi:hypothetical protein
VNQQLGFGITAIALVAAIALVIHLWRSRRDSQGEWSRQDSLTALGLLVALIGIAVPLALSEGSADEESPQVRAYRQDVIAACGSLAATTNPFMDAMNPDGTFNRDNLLNGMRNQVRAAEGVLDALWEQDPPAEVADEARVAKGASNKYLATSRQTFDRVRDELPQAISFQQLSALTGRLDADLRPATSRLEAAMSRLAGQSCMREDKPAP